jgi:ketosteroid isomerase-like protein
MSTLDRFDEMLERYHLALGEFTKGNPEPAKQLMSHREDVSIANPYDPPVRGWEKVAQVMDHASSLRQAGEVSFEIASKYVTPELAYVVEIERARAKVGGREDMTPYSPRATIIFRREDGEWKAVHRHADPITTAQAAEWVLKNEAEGRSS